MISNNEFFESFPKTRKLMGSFDFQSSAPLISTLHTFPELHANTLRLQGLVILASLACWGTKKAGVEDLREWVSSFEKEYPFLHLEDPLEDVFTSYVVTPMGGWITFSGIFTSGHFWLERLLNFLEEKTDFPTFQEIFDASVALVKLADATARRSELERYSQGSGNPGKKADLPEDDSLENRMSAVVFSDEDLKKEGVNKRNLQKFEFTKKRREGLLEERLFGNSIEQCPILYCEDHIVLLDPSQVCRATVHFILDGVSKVMGGWADTFFEKESAEFFVNDVLRFLKIDAITIELPTPPESLPPFLPYCGQFDYGKPVLALVFTAKLSDGALFDQAVAMTDEQIEDFEEYLHSCCQALSIVDGFTGGMVLAGLSSVGRDLLIGFNEIPENWHFFGASLCEWRTLRAEKRFDAFRLWRLGEQLAHAEKLNFQISNFSGLVNLYAYWKWNGYLLVPQNAEIGKNQTRLSIASNFCHDLNVELQRRPDAHCRLNHQGDRWTHLQRINSGHHPDFQVNSVYGDVSTVGEGLFVGCSENSETVWWVECKESATHAYSRDCKFQLWECLLNWVDSTAPFVQELIPEGIESILVRLHLPDLDEWAVESLPSMELPEEDGSLSVELESSKTVIDLTIPENFIHVFHSPINDAEKALVRAIVEGVVELSGSNDSVVVDRIVQKVIPNPDARHFHVLRVQKLEHNLAEAGKPMVRYIPVEEVNNLQLGLADTVGRPSKKKRSDRDAVVKFLTDLVENLWEQVEAGLKQYDLGSTVMLCFQQLDQIGIEKSQWDSTTRALLALHNNEYWINDKIHEKREELTLAEIANRLILEIAMYSGAQIKLSPIPLAEHSRLMATIRVLLDLANYRDAIAGGFMEPTITIHPNGAVEVDRKFFDEVFSPYIKSHIDDQIRLSADNYETYFTSLDEAESDSEKEISDEGKIFLKVFETEFGFPFDTLGDVLEMFYNRAMETQNSIVVIASQDLQKMIAQRSEIDSQKAAKFIERFTLPKRKGWNKNLGHFKERDVLPWCHRRSFSILSRPLIHLDDGPRMLMISATHLHRWFQYFLDNLESGYFPPDHFRSDAMKRHLGAIANREGHAFAKRVFAEIQGLKMECRLEVSLTSLGAPALPDLGDIDVLAWNKQTYKVYLIECKRLKTALTARDVIQRLEEFRGKEGDKLGKHIARVDWIRANPDELSKLTGISALKIEFIPMLLTSDRVPMKFVKVFDFPSEWVVSFQDIDQVF